MKRHCKQCDCMTIHTIVHETNMGPWHRPEGLWKCGNCDVTSVRYTRTSRKHAAMNELFDDLTTIVANPDAA